MPLCVAYRCRGKGGHTFPTDSVLKKKWEEALQLKQTNKHSRICNKHFKPTDYRTFTSTGYPFQKKHLKKTAVPSIFEFNRPERRTRRKQLLQKKNITSETQQKLSRGENEDKNGKQRVNEIEQKNSTGMVFLQIETKKKQLKRLKKMTEAVEEEPKVDGWVQPRECRTCLKPMPESLSACNIFQAWTPAWIGMAPTIAEDLAKIANVEVPETDKPPDVICEPCYRQLLQAATFAAKVRVCDQILRRRYETEMENASKVWPKPIQVDKNINGDIFQDVEIKQEKLSDDEYDMIIPDVTYGADDPYAQSDRVEIKIEPEDESPPLQITINATMSLNPESSTTTESSTVIPPESSTVVNGTGEYEAIITDGVSNSELSNGNDFYYDEQHLDTLVKEEPRSEGEDVEQPPELSLDCILCAKVFNTVTGLKAHVIAQHSYKSVKRKLHGGTSPVKKPREEHKCQICGRSFTTSTDLMVHETCHNKHVCYVCSQKFDSFKLLTRHRKKCVAPPPTNAIKKLDDVIRSSKEDKLSNSDIDQTSQDSTDSSMKLHLEIHSKNSDLKSETSSNKSEMEAVNDVETQMKMLNQDCTL